MLLRRGKEQTVSGKVNRNIWLSHFRLQWSNQRDLKSRSSERGHPCARTWAISLKGIEIGFEHTGDFLAILPSQEKEWAPLEVKCGALWFQHSLCGGKWLIDKNEFRETAGKHSTGFPEVSVDQKYSPQLCGALRTRLGLLLKCSPGGGVGCHLVSRQTERRFGQTELTWEGYPEHRIPYCTCNSILGRVRCQTKYITKSLWLFWRQMETHVCSKISIQNIISYGCCKKNVSHFWVLVGLIPPEGCEGASVPHLSPSFWGFTSHLASSSACGCITSSHDLLPASICSLPSFHACHCVQFLLLFHYFQYVDLDHIELGIPWWPHLDYVS